LRLLVSGATRTLRRLGPSPRLGFLLTPRAGNGVEAIKDLGMPWAADNSAFSGFDEGRFVRMLDRVAGVPGCLWVAAPDVVADAARTLDLFDAWQPRIAGRGLPVALVGQDGLEVLEVPWDRMDALFLGGSTEWKLGEHARRLAGEARAREKLVHCGRVNSRRRIRHAAAIGCDSVDGSCFSRWPDTKITPALRWLEEAEAMVAGEATG
jgi:hypothetical protein